MVTLQTEDGLSVCFAVPREQQSELGEALMASSGSNATLRMNYPGPAENFSRPAIEPPGRLRRSTQLEASKQAHHGRRLPVATARRRYGALG
jgi:hypothetical protein